MAHSLKHWWIYTSALFIAVCAVWLWPSPPSLKESQTGAVVETKHVLPLTTSAQKAVPKTQTLSSELADLPMPYHLAVDEQGNLIISSDLKEFFEFYLSAHDVRDIELKQTFVKTKLAEVLAQPALAQALTIFDQYMAAKQALAELLPEGETQLVLLQQRQAILSSYLGLEVYSAFYDDEHRYMAYLLDLKAINASNLSEQEKQASISVLTIDLDNEQRFLQQPHIQLQQMAQHGNTQSQVDQVRMQYGNEAALRYEAVLQSRSNFQQRVDAFRGELESISATLNGEQKKQFIGQMLQQQFNETEQLRVRALLGLPLS